VKVEVFAGVTARVVGAAPPPGPHEIRIQDWHGEYEDYPFEPTRVLQEVGPDCLLAKSAYMRPSMYLSTAA
jgi:hypothetical protein